MNQKVMSGAEIRQSFLDFFEKQGHTIVPSASLVPGGDETLLFTNAGMVQFKDVFLGTGRRPYTRAVDSQKCMRVAGKHNDLDDVGRDDTHHTFFEMLGNWSFGDYYKAEAIGWAWELLTEQWGLPKERIWATCFEDELGEIPRDDDAAEIWAQQPGFDSSQIVFFGREENFWEMADTGPSGPDSEMHLDQGLEYCDMQNVQGHECQVSGECARFLELWNLVFIQYNRTSPTQLDPLPKMHVDTGMGFERVVSVLQGTHSNYKTDLLFPLIETTRNLAGHSEAQVEEHWTPYRVIADHARSAAFLIGDGVVPGNLGRNYVTRMIIRRAALFGGKLGFNEPFLADVAETVIENYAAAYPELEDNAEAIGKLITDEEQRFARTVEGGIAKLTERLDRLADQRAEVLPGQEAFDLYATYGLPLEIARDIAREQGAQIDEAGFFEAMEHHREVSVGKLGQIEGNVELAELTARYQRVLDSLVDKGELDGEGVRYDPYGELKLEGRVLALLREGEEVEQASEGEVVAVVLPETPFYVEAGGQVSDKGMIRAAAGPDWEIAVEDTRMPVDGLVIHLGRVVQGEPKPGDEASVAVDETRRLDIMRNHTATHLLHTALRTVLGPHARQAGSLVAPDRLRFDFTHGEPVTNDQLKHIERIVNDNVLANYSLLIRLEGREQAVRQGAIALFGETYGDTVRTICIGEPTSGSSPVLRPQAQADLAETSASSPVLSAQAQADFAELSRGVEPDCFSYELCGGTHVPETGLIGPFLIVSESSVAAGIRRIEAVTGRVALETIQQRLGTLDEMAMELGVAVSDSHARLVKILEERDQLQRELERALGSRAEEQFNRLAPEPVDGVPVLTGLISGANAEALRSLLDQFRSEHPTGVAVLASSVDDRPIIVAAVTQDLVARGLHAGELVKSVAEEVGGGGGGKATMAQAGGKDATKLPEALARVPAWVEARLGRARRGRLDASS